MYVLLFLKNSSCENSSKWVLYYTRRLILMVIVTAAVIGCDMTTLGLFKEWTPAVPITPQLHLSHLQPFISATRQKSIHLSHAFSLTLTLPLSHICTLYLDISVLLFHFNRLFKSLFSFSLSFSSFFFPSHSFMVRAFKAWHLFFLPPFPAVFDSSLRISKDQGF